MSATTVQRDTRRDLALVAADIAVSVVRPAASDVDRAARFPTEAFEALRAHRLLSAFVPTDLGGGGASIAEVGAVIEALARECASTAMIYAMHQIQVACLVRHYPPALESFLRQVAAEELLLASATTEVGIGGDVRTSRCAVEATGSGTFQLRKEAGVISYAEQADGILVTARRDPEAPSSDQVIAVVRRDQYHLEPRQKWATLGFRGTCSDGFLLTATGNVEEIIDTPYADVSALTMLPMSHITWGHVWLGLAEGAIAKAHAHVRTTARQTPGSTPPSALRLAEAMVELHAFRSLVHGAASDYDAALGCPDRLGSMAFAIRMNNLKLSSSTMVVDLVARALQICGLAGYREDSPLSLGRELRDAYGAALMVNNDRIFSATAQLLLIAKAV
jgi:acyl-CoA dehydrogenase